MDSGVININGINWSDYILDKNSSNPLVYIHKRYLSKRYNEEKIEEKANSSKTYDKCQQFNANEIRVESYTTKIAKKDPVLEHTIKFAKDIIPFTIPPTNLSSKPVYYTIKSSKETKRKHETCEHKSKYDKDVTFNKDKIKHEMEKKLERCKRVKASAEDSLSRSSQNNTVDDINENQSLCCSSSEMSDLKQLKEELCQRRNKRKDIQKIIPSETVDAIASEYINTSSDSKIKIHLMNEKEKHIFCESITAPVVQSIKELFSELDNHNEVKKEISYVHKKIENHGNKLDNILEKLMRIENSLNKLTKDKNNENDFKTSNISKLEEISKDIIDNKDNFSSEEELAQVDLLMNRSGKTASITNTAVKDRNHDEIDDFSRGENILEHYKPSTSQAGVKPERPNRIPARFCWTDNIKKN